jgi:hypothetical protein
MFFKGTPTGGLSPTRPSTCLQEKAIYNYVIGESEDGELSAEEKSQVEHHILGCSLCKNLLLSLSHTVEDLKEDPARYFPEQSKRKKE